MKRAVYPGSFDPITYGHSDIILRASNFFDKLYILVGRSFDKRPLFSFEERVKIIQKTLSDNKSCIEVVGWSGLTVDFVKEQKIDCIIRGVRSSVDFRSEQTLANVNAKLHEGCETLLFCCRPEFRDVSSRMVKEIALHHGELSQFVPPFVEKKLKEKFKKIRGEDT